MLVRSRAIVLHSLRYGDNKIIVHCLTEREGCVTFLLHRSSKRSSQHRLLQPLSIVEVDWNKTSRLGMVHLKQLTSVYQYATIPYEPAKATVALFLSEFLYATLHREPASSHIYMFVEQSLMLYDKLTANYANFHIALLLQLASFLGFGPNIVSYRPGKFFDLREGSFSSHVAIHTDFVPPAEAQMIPILLRMTFANMHRFRLSGAGRSLLLSYILSYYRLHIPAFPELKSLSIVKEIWA